MHVFALLMVVRAEAQVVAPGTTKVLIDYAAQGDTSAANIAITGDGPELYYALESLACEFCDQPSLTIIKQTPANQWGNVSSILIQAQGSFTAAGMYPTITTEAGDNNIWLTGKMDTLAGNHDQLRIYKVWKFPFVPASLAEQVTNDTSRDHGIPNLITYDGREHLCWTNKAGGAAAPTDDLPAKIHDSNFSTPWASTADFNVSISTDPEDHCNMSYTSTAERYTVFHRDTLTNDIWLQIAQWGGAVGTGFSFPLLGSAGANFPSIWSDDTLPFPQKQFFIVAESNGSVLFWQCTNTAGGTCMSQQDFGQPTTVGVGADHADLKVFALKIPDGFQGYQVGILYQTNATKNVTRNVKLLRRCNNVWAERGPLPLPTTHDDFHHSELGANIASSKPSVYLDGTTVHAAFLARGDGSAQTVIDPNTTVWQLDPMHWFVAYADFCT